MQYLVLILLAQISDSGSEVSHDVCGFILPSTVHRHGSRTTHTETVPGFVFSSSMFVAFFHAYLHAVHSTVVQNISKL